MDKIEPTFSQIGSGSAIITGATARGSGKIDILGTPAILSYLDQISGELKRMNDESSIETSLAGLTLLMGANVEALKGIMDAVDTLEPEITIPAPTIQVNLPEIKPKINVYPTADTVTTLGKPERILGVCIAVILWGILIMMINAQYSFLSRWLGGE